jgi:hypothetical protein
LYQISFLVKKKNERSVMPHSLVDFSRSDRDAGENLMAETSACSPTTRMARAVRGLCYDPEGYPYTKILDNPLAKIFGGIPAGPTFHPRFSEALQRSLKKLYFFSTDVLYL